MSLVSKIKIRQWKFSNASGGFQEKTNIDMYQLSLGTNANWIYAFCMSNCA